jgi:Tol biopolymer transport system component/uncharacterized protein YgiM (DUF1202 family)
LNVIMKKHFWILLLVLLLTGCGISHKAEGEHLKPLDPAKWPTPRAVQAAASPTPFPRATLRIEPSPSAEVAAAETPPPTPAAVEAAAAPPASAPTGAGNNDIVAALASQALNQFSIVATGIATAPDLSIRGGPGANYSSVRNIQPGDVFGILGKNSGGDWVYVIGASLSPGWLPTNSIRVVGSLAQAPVLPPNPLAALIQSSSATSLGENGAPAEAAAPTSSQPVIAANLTPVTTAQVNNEGLNMRQGPGANYERIATLAHNDKVTILALNPRKDWALVETTGQQRGWVSLAYLAVEGSVADAPIVPAAALHQTGSTTEITPAVNPPVTASGQTAVAAPVPVADKQPANSAAAFGNLGPVATAKITHDPVDVRPGPGTDYAAIDDLRLSDENIPILATDKSRQWVLVNPVSAQPGWVALSDLNVESSLENAPQVDTAWVESNAIEIRRGPGIYHDAVGVLSIKTLVSVLGLDDSRSWALVKAIPAGVLGWAPINFLNPAGRWSDLPKAPDLPLPGDSAAASQTAVAPFVPARPISESKIVFQRSSGSDIMVINPDGTGLRRLTSGIDPVLSPDGQTVAFTRWEGETGSVWTINVDGTNERSIIGFVKQAKGPDWSPDGSQLVFNFQTGGRTDPKTECFPVGEGKSPPRPPRNATDFKVSFGSKGPQFCWKLPPDPHWGLRVVNLTDGNFKDVDGGTYAFRPTWDPSQAWRIVSDGGRGLLEVDVNRDYRQSITDELNDGSPVFSPDGRYLAVTMGQQGGGPGWDIFRLNANGTGRVRLTQTPLWETAAPGNDKPWNNVAPAWSPDGSQIAFVTDRTGRWEIWVMNADGSDQHPLFSDEVNDQLQLNYNFVDERVLSWQ